MASIRVFQSNSASASQSVWISIDGVYVGNIGPGGMVTGQSVAAEGQPWKVMAVCGMYRAELED